MKGLFVLLLFSLVSGQVLAQISDDFGDSDLKTNPAWMGNLDAFEVLNGELKLASTGTSKSYLSTKTTWKDTASWQFYFRLEFAPSTSNQLKIYLSFDNSDLTAAGNGYLLRIGESGNEDNLEFCKQSGTTITKLAEGALSSMGNLTTNQARIKVTRSQKGEFIIQTDLSGGTNFTTDFSVTDNSYKEGDYFGFQCIYTSTRADKFFFDDVFIGGREEGMLCKNGSIKSFVLVSVEVDHSDTTRKEGQLKRSNAEVIDDAYGELLNQVLEDTVDYVASVTTDGWTGYFTALSGR